MSTRKSAVWRRAATTSLALALLAASWGYYTQASPASVLARAATGDGGDVETFDTPAPAVAGGPGVSRPGILLDVRPTPDGSLTVTETVQLRDTVDRILLRVPRVGMAGEDFSDLTPLAIAVELSVDDRQAEVPGEVGDDPTQVYLPGGTTTYTVRYVLTGTAAAGRTPAEAVVAVGPLSQAGPAGRVNLVASSPTLALTCPLVAGTAADCGTPAGDGYQLREPLPGRSALVLVRTGLSEG